MFCHRCGASVASEVRFCPNCGQALPPPATSPAGAQALPAWMPPSTVVASPGRWISEGWSLVQADLGNYVLIALLFFLLSGVPLIQGALIVGFHIYTMKKLQRAQC